MLEKIKNKVERDLPRYLGTLNKRYALSRISPLLFSCVREFILRKGKRIRPILLIIGYLGFAKKAAPSLYTSALSLELLHDFMLVHDDIIDRSDLRRGKPSMHSMLNSYLKGYRNVKFNGQELAIVAGDIMFALGIHAFLAIREEPRRKEEALKKLIETAMYTASGEFLELLSGIKDIKKTEKKDIYRIYNYKTAYYTFASPLTIGAILAGASRKEIKRLFKYGECLGRAFQIKDDILGMFADEKTTGKSALTDLQEAKKTILIWQAFQKAGRQDKNAIKNILTKKTISYRDLTKMRCIITRTGALDYARREIVLLIKHANKLLSASTMRRQYKEFLLSYAEKILQ